MPKVKKRYICQNCGYVSPRYLGRCPECGAWNQMEEEVVSDTSSTKTNKNSIGSIRLTNNKPEKIENISLTKTPRFQTKIAELDRVLGGGLVPGSLILIGGEPGIGKSTLLTQLSGNLQGVDKVVLYVSGEESASQIKLRADRLAVNNSNFYVLAETDMGNIRGAIDSLKPDFLIVDSIQTMNEPELDSAIGSVSQVRQITNELMNIAKSVGITTFIVGHVTKEGSIAGPKILEHMVDTVLYFEGDKHHAYRILRAVKNRFGAANELGIFAMNNSGLTEVANPSELFLEERLAGATGSAVVVSMEGSRPILVELQALLTPTLFGNAKRTTNGLDFNRVAVIMAVLEKRGGLMLQNQDAYLKATGGVKLNEPAIDLAIAVAIASSYRNKEVNPEISFVGELGLTGEIRRVSDIQTRVQEAQKLGFKQIFIPKNNLTDLNELSNKITIKLIPVKTITDALTKLDL